MQREVKEYNAESHDRFKALCVKQPYADRLIAGAYGDNGNTYAVKSIEVRSRDTSYRGTILICSSAKPIIPGMTSGVTVGFVELYGTKRVEDFTDEDWDNTTIPENERPRTGFGWMMRNPKRVIEMPVRGQLGIFNLVYDKGEIIEYPTIVKVDKESWKIIQKGINNGKESD